MTKKNRLENVNDVCDKITNQWDESGMPFSLFPANYVFRHFVLDGSTCEIKKMHQKKRLQFPQNNIASLLVTITVYAVCLFLLFSNMLDNFAADIFFSYLPSFSS